MLPRGMRRFVSAFAILLLCLTAQAMAVARGQTTTADGQAILCTGAGLITVTLDATGKPTGKPTGRAPYCPDCALSLVLALALPDLPVRMVQARAAVFDVVADATALVSPLPGPGARDPPHRV